MGPLSEKCRVKSRFRISVCNAYTGHTRGPINVTCKRPIYIFTGPHNFLLRTVLLLINMQKYLNAKENTNINVFHSIDAVFP